MAEDQGSKEDKFDPFTREGETLGYISLEQARVLAMRHARDNTDFYGSAYSRINLVWEVISQDEGEDYYDIKLSFRPAGRFRGDPGVEQFIIDKTGSIEIRQILDEPTGMGRVSGRRPRYLLPSAIGVGMVAVVAIVAVLASGALGGDGRDDALSPVTAGAPQPDQPVAASPSDAQPTATGLPQLTQPTATTPPRAQPTATAAPSAQPTATTFFPTPAPTATSVPTLTATRPPRAQPAAPAPLLTVAFSAGGNESVLPWQRNLIELLQVRPMYEFLLDVDRSTGQLVPMLAENWEVGDGGRSWTFTLRPGVQFHDGWGEFTVSDVVHSFQMLTQEGSRASSVPFWQEALRNIRGIDKFTVQFELNRPVPDFDHMVSAEQDFVMLSRAQWDAEGPDGVERRPAGTGPYRFVEQKGAELKMFHRVAEHWRRTPDFEELHMFSIREDATRAAVLQAGQVHIAEVPLSFRQLALSAGMKFNISHLPAYQVAWLMGGQYYATPDKLDNAVPWTNPRVRRAMNLAIDRELINKELMQGLGDLMSVAGFHPSLPGWNPAWEPYPFDPQRAKRLLAEAGFPDGFALEMVSTPAFPDLELLGEVLGDMLGSVGVKVALKQLDLATLVGNYRNKEMSGSSWGARIRIRQTSEAIRVMNYSGPTGALFGYEDPKIDKLYEQLVQEIDPSVREERLREIGDIKFRNFAEIPLFWVPAAVGLNPEVVKDYVFPGTISGQISHLEYMEAAQ